MADVLDRTPDDLVAECARDFVEANARQARVYFEAMADALGYRMAVVPAAAA